MRHNQVPFEGKVKNAFRNNLLSLLSVQKYSYSDGKNENKTFLPKSRNRQERALVGALSISAFNNEIEKTLRNDIEIIV